MKTLLLIAGLISCFETHAQWGALVVGGITAAKHAGRFHRDKGIDDLPYRVDSFHYYQEVVLMQRYEEKDLLSVHSNNPRENAVARELHKLQIQLDYMHDYVVEGHDINFFRDVEQKFNYIRMQNTSFDLTVYDREYAFYSRYQEGFLERKREANYKAAQERIEAAAKMEESRREKRRIEDSLYVIREGELRTERRKEAQRQDSITRIEAKENERLERIANQKAKIAAQKAKAVQDEKKQKKHADLVARYGEDIVSYIEAKQVKIGMTKEMCIAAWGKPYDINRTTNSYGVREQWVYSLKSYLYFDDGILTTVQN